MSENKYQTYAIARQRVEGQEQQWREAMRDERNMTAQIAEANLAHSRELLEKAARAAGDRLDEFARRYASERGLAA